MRAIAERNLGHQHSFSGQISWQRSGGRCAVNDWINIIAWLVTGASFLFLSMLVLVPSVN
jgi:hypothetical protein